MIKFIIAAINYRKVRILITTLLLSTLFGSIVITTRIMQASIFNNYRFIMNTASDYWIIKYPMAITNQPIFDKPVTAEFINEVSDYAKVTPLYILAVGMNSTDNTSTDQGAPLTLRIYKSIGAFNTIQNLSDLKKYTAHEQSNRLIGLMSVSNNDFQSLGISIPKHLNTLEPFILGPRKQRDTSLNYGTDSIAMLNKPIPIIINNKTALVTGTYDLENPPLFVQSLFIIDNVERVMSLPQDESLPYTHLMIHLNDPSKLTDLRNLAQEYFPKTTLLPKKQYALNTVLVNFAQIDTRSLFLAGLITLAAAIIIISTTFQIFTRDQRAIYSMLEALGVKKINLFIVNTIEVYIISIVSSALGLILGILVYSTFLDKVIIPDKLNISFILFYLLITNIIAAISVAIPYKELSKISPDAIFIGNEHE